MSAQTYNPQWQAQEAARKVAADVQALYDNAVNVDARGNVTVGRPAVIPVPPPSPGVPIGAQILPAVLPVGPTGPFVVDNFPPITITPGDDEWSQANAVDESIPTYEEKATQTFDTGSIGYAGSGTGEADGEPRQKARRKSRKKVPKGKGKKAARSKAQKPKARTKKAGKKTSQRAKRPNPFAI